MRILFLGPPAAGKGTQAKMLQERTNVSLLVMGDILREAIQKQDEAGKELEKYVKQGVLVPDPLVIQIIMHRLELTEKSSPGFLLDGFPRTIQQAQALEKAMQEKNWRLDYVIYYKLEDALAIERIAGRRVCKKCNSIYHIKYNPPKQENICDSCNGELFQRSDDKEDVMKTRLSAYYEKTMPLLSYYKGKGILIEINANNTIEKVSEETLKYLKIF
ncbi:MAG: adenylate kinase [Candidatus Brocadiae bacterium]|nr:adenylate kinase [Candidatus Brocadiia bacterium]